MIFKYLSGKFYHDFPSADYPEMMLKEQRPYTQAITDIGGLKFAIPLRSGISHKMDVLWTDKRAKHGLDFTKAVVILDDSYLSDEKVFIREQEYKHLLGKERRVSITKKQKLTLKKNTMLNIADILLCNILKNTYMRTEKITHPADSDLEKQ